MREALTPSGDTKAAYMGEFFFTEYYIDEDGSPVTSVSVPQKEGGRNVDQVKWNDKVNGN